MVLTVHIDPELCKSCGLCVALCPKQVFEIGHEMNRKGYRFAAAARQESCIGCRKGQRMCPDFAIFVETGESGMTRVQGKE